MNRQHSVDVNGDTVTYNEFTSQINIFTMTNAAAIVARLLHILLFVEQSFHRRSERPRLSTDTYAKSLTWVNAGIDEAKPSPRLKHQTSWETSRQDWYEDELLPLLRHLTYCNL